MHTGVHCDECSTASRGCSQPKSATVRMILQLYKTNHDKFLIKKKCQMSMIHGGRRGGGEESGWGAIFRTIPKVSLEEVHDWAV